MKPLFDPSLISLDNAAEDFWQDYRRKRGLPVASVSEAELIRAEVDLFQTMSQHSGHSPAQCREIFKEELGKLPPRPRESESESDRLFIESGNKLIAAHRAQKKRFSWAGLFGFLVLAVMVGALTYLFVEGW